MNKADADWGERPGAGCEDGGHLLHSKGRTHSFRFVSLGDPDNTRTKQARDKR